MERFHRRAVLLELKMEHVWQRPYANHTETRNDIADSIVSFYNGERLHSALGNLLPTATSGKWQRKNLLQWPKLLDHGSLPTRRAHAARTCCPKQLRRLNSQPTSVACDDVSNNSAAVLTPRDARFHHCENEEHGRSTTGNSSAGGRH